MTTSFLDPRRLQRMTQIEAQNTLNCLTRLRRGLDMLHWHCHASNYQQTTDNKFLCRLQGTSTVPFTAHALNRRIPIVARSNQKTKKQQVHRSFHLSTYQYTGVPLLPSAHVPIHRCKVPTICSRTNTQVCRSFLPFVHRTFQQTCLSWCYC